MALTEQQAAVLAFVRDFVRENGYPPTRAEIACHMRFASNNAAEDHLQALARKGMLRIVPRVARRICLVER